MVSITQDHRCQILLPPLIEVLSVVVVILALFPAVKGLVYHKDAITVARVEKCGRWRIVAGTDGVEAVFFHQLNATFFGAVDRGCAERAVVVMHAAALEFHDLAIEFEALLGRESQRADTERRPGTI